MDDTERNARSDRLLFRIMVAGFSLAFGAVVASLQALRPTASGFSIELSGWTLMALLLAAVILAPFFHVIVFSSNRRARALSLTIVVLTGLISFFYPMRVVPKEKYRPVFVGLAVAAAALSILAALLFSLYRFFEADEKRNREPGNRTVRS